MMTLWPGASSTSARRRSPGRRDQELLRDGRTSVHAENHWEFRHGRRTRSTTVNGDKGTLTSSALLDVKTGKVMAVVGVDHNVQKINGKWLIVDSAGATPVLSP